MTLSYYDESCHNGGQCGRNSGEVNELGHAGLVRFSSPLPLHYITRLRLTLKIIKIAFDRKIKNRIVLLNV